jgi:hypothetical protein
MLWARGNLVSEVCGAPVRGRRIADDNKCDERWLAFAQARRYTRELGLSPQFATLTTRRKLRILTVVDTFLGTTTKFVSIAPSEIGLLHRS